MSDTSRPPSCSLREPSPPRGERIRANYFLLVSGEMGRIDEGMARCVTFVSIVCLQVRPTRVTGGFFSSAGQTLS